MSSRGDTRDPPATGAGRAGGAARGGDSERSPDGDPEACRDPAPGAAGDDATGPPPGSAAVAAGEPRTRRGGDSGPPCEGGGSGAPPGPTRWGICGAGHISHDFAVALKTLPPEEHVLLAVAARELPRAQEFARRHGVPRAYGGYQRLAEDPDVDVVYVGTVNPQHLPVARLLLAARKPLLVEKPLGLNRQEVQEAAELAREHGVFLMEGFWTRFFPAWRRLQELLAEPPPGGALGDPLLLVASLGFDLRARPRLRDPALGGGALLDLGGYGLQMAIALLGTPQDITARGCLHHTGVDESVSLTLRFGGGRLAAICCSMAAELPGGAALGCTRGWAEFPTHMNCPTELVLGGRKESFPLPPPSQPLNFPHGTGLRYEAQHVRDCLRRGLLQSPCMPLAQSLLVAELLDEARRQVGAAGPQTHG